jgi:hypothetical protein
MGQVKSSGCFTQRGQILVCQLDFLVCFIRITKRSTTFNHPHPVETMTGPYFTSNMLSVTFQIPVIANTR